MLVNIMDFVKQFNDSTAKQAGLIIPVVLEKLKIDPALSSSIFLTTATDVLGFFLFLGLASVFLSKLL